MSEAAVIFLLILCIIILSSIIIYQRIHFKKGIHARLKEVSDKLEDILASGSDEKVMVFTDDSALMELSGQINLLLEEYQKIKVENRRSQAASKKMLSNISHDIKTPMTVILGYLEMIRLESPEENELLQKVEEKARKVMELITQFFTLAKLEAGDTDLEMSKISLNECCREAVLDFYELLTQKDFRVEVEIPEQPVYTLGDRDALRRILENLISNAIRYGADGNYLGIHLHSDEKYVYIDISDKGKGIDKAFSDRIFERLFTMEDSRNREIQGNGLGLTIAKSLANQLGGDIYLISTPYVLTTFTLKLKKLAY